MGFVGGGGRRRRRGRFEWMDGWRDVLRVVFVATCVDGRLIDRIR